MLLTRKATSSAAPQPRLARGLSGVLAKTMDRQGLESTDAGVRTPPRQGSLADIAERGLAELFERGRAGGHLQARLAEARKARVAGGVAGRHRARSGLRRSPPGRPDRQLIPGYDPLRVVVSGSWRA